MYVCADVCMYVCVCLFKFDCKYLYVFMYECSAVLCCVAYLPTPMALSAPMMCAPWVSELMSEGPTKSPEKSTSGRPKPPPANSWR